MVSPIHFAEGTNTTDQVPVSQLIGPGIVIDVTDRAAADVDNQVSAADIEAFEAGHGRIPAGAIVLLNTGGPGSTRTARPIWARPNAATQRCQSSTSRDSGPTGTATGRPRHLGGGSRHALNRPRTVEGLRGPCRADDPHRPGLRERCRHERPAGDGKHDHRPADEDRARLRGEAPGRRLHPRRRVSRSCLVGRVSTRANPRAAKTASAVKAGA